MRTAIDWYEDLPEDIQHAAMSNIEVRYMLIVRDSLAHAIMTGFVWQDTEEGHSFWQRVYSIAFNGWVISNWPKVPR